ncbi:MAG: DUF1566 domain-containing protein [Proteobacteria bacterium]|nr:DUF1566 domain-containing protein [Pseudomonadota bacterium]
MKKICYLIVLFLFLTSTTFAGTVSLPRTGQTKCYDTAGTEMPCAGTGQDGDIQAGVPWPEPRFTDHGNGTATDNLTGLMWTKNGNLPNSTKTWQQALDYVLGMNAGTYPNYGYTDWRLSNVNELKSLVNCAESNTATWLNTQGFTNVQADDYWSSTAYVSLPDYAWVVRMWYGRVSYGHKLGNVGFYIWPVRGGDDNSYPAQVWQTGQKDSYAEGDDGDLEQGVAWPSPRFTDHGDIVTDNLTGLMWTKNANLPNGDRTWQQALGYVAGMNAGTYPNFGYADWRLPNRKELHSLTDYSRYLPALPSGQPFTNVQGNGCWSSTTYADDPDRAWVVYIGDGSNLDCQKSSDNNYYVWPVRGGQICTFGISPTNQSFTSLGGTGTVRVTTQSGCNWTATSNASWINITSGNSGSGNGTVYYSVSANATADSRTGTITVAENSFTVEQEVCSMSIEPTNQSFAAAGGTGYITVTSVSGCSWTATTNDSWITITSSANGTGNGTIYYNVASNISTVTTNPRNGSITVGDQTFTITQEGRACIYSLTPLSQAFSVSGGSGSIDVTATNGCSWTATNSDYWITITSDTNGTGSGTVNFAVSVNSGACPRTGTITIADQVFTITQQGASCLYSIIPEEQTFSTAGGNAYITMTTESCCSWIATSNVSWIIITSGLSGTGNGIVQYSVTANLGSSRTGTITVEGRTFTVIQDGIPGAECSTWTDVITKYNSYVSGSSSWNDVITCYNQYASPSS